MTEHVHTNGFVAPPSTGPAAAPNVPGQNAAPAPAPSGSGDPIVGANQQPGWVQNPGQGTPAPVQQPQPQAPAQAAQPDMTQVVALLQQALGNQGVPAADQVPGTPDPVRPSWMHQSANEYDVSKIDDPIIKSMATVLQTAGKDLDLDRVLGRALTHGDYTLIDTAYLYEKGGAQAMQLAEIAKGIVQAVNAKAEAVTKGVHDLAGGEANWHSSVQVFNQAAPQELRVTVSRMLDSADPGLINAGAKIVAEFGKASGKLPQPGTLLQNGTAAPAGANGLSRAQFQEELRKLDQNKPGFIEARQALFARRSLGKRTGLN